MKKVLRVLSLCLMSLLTILPTAFAEDPAAAAAAKIDTGDTGFVLMSAALVMLMTPGLALFYGGMVRTKNVLSTLMQSFFIVGLISVQWVLWGYTVAFGPDINHLIGGFDWLGLNGVGQEPNADYAATIPHLAFMIFQGMFAVITPALISGAFAERMKFPAFLVFTLAWATFVYDPVAHWVWGTGGWLREMGVLDFAGGTVVHIISGVSGLVIALMLGKRKDYGRKAIIPHNLPMVLIGGALLWFGWFGFNAGSALGANGLAASAFVTTHASAAAATVSWVIAEWMYSGKPTVLGAVSGCVAGLVAITAGCDLVSPLGSAIIGLLAGIILVFSIEFIDTKLHIDDPVGASSVHGVCGIFGTLMTGLFALDGGAFYGGGFGFFGAQCFGILCIDLWAAVTGIILFWGIKKIAGLRVDKRIEEEGLDIYEHGESCYN